MMIQWKKMTIWKSDLDYFEVHTLKTQFSITLIT